jgi:hypothetical protein
MSVIVKLLSKFDDSGIKKAKGSFGGLKGAIGTLGIGIGISQIADGIRDIITLASNAQEQTAAVGQIFGKGTGIIDKFAATANTNLGQTKNGVYEAAKSFGIYGKAAGLSEKANAEFSTGLISIATDLASFNNTSPEDAVNALGSALRGESEPLRRYGVLLTDKIVKDKGMALGLGTMTKTAKGFTYTMTEQEKILARRAVIMEQTVTQQGDFARTSGGLANQQRILTASFEDAKTTLGTALLPMFTDFVKYLNDNVIPVVQQFVEDVSDPKTEAGKMFLNIKDAVQKTFQGVQDFFALFGDGDAMKGFANVASSLIQALPALLALKGILMLASAGKSIANLAKAIALMTGAGAAGDGSILAGGKNKKGIPGNKLPIMGLGAAVGVGLVLMTSGDATINPERQAYRQSLDPKTGLPKGYKMPALGSGIFANGKSLAAQTTNNNITIQVQSADPKAVVDAVSKYAKNNGGLPSVFFPGGKKP